MNLTILAAFFEVSRTAISMCSAGLVLFLIGILAAKRDIGQARGVDKVVALSNLCFAVPLAVFGAEHLSGAQFIQNGVPPYVPWHLFWAYFVGFALIAASLSIATKIAVRWSALMFGIMMFLFVAMIHLPGALHTHQRIPWTIVFRECSFGGGAWLLAASAMYGSREQATGPPIKGTVIRTTLITIGRILVALAIIFFAVEHFLHPTGLPGVPLEKQLATWIPARVLIDYVTGAALLVAGVFILLNRKTQTRRHMARLLALAHAPRYLCACPDRGTTRPKHRGQGGRNQLLCRHASLYRSHSRGSQGDNSI